MAIAFVKKSTQTFGDGVTSFSTSLAGVGAGNLVAVTVDKASGGDSNNPALAMPAPDGGAWLTAIAGTGPTGTGAYRPVNAIFYKLASAGGTETVNWSSLPGDSYIEATISEFSCSGTWAFDAGIRTVGDGASPQSVSGISNSTAVALAIAVVATDANTISNLVGPTTGYTQIDLSDNNSAHNCYGSGYKILSATAAQSAGWTWTGSGPWMGSLAIFREVAGAGGVTCTLAVTDTADTVSSTATVGVSASLAQTDAADTVAATALVAVVANLGVTDAADSLASTAGMHVVAGLSVTDAADSLASTAVVGNPPVTCDLAVTDAADTLAAIAAALVVSSLTATDAGDTLSAAAQAAVVAALAVTDESDTLSAVAVTSGPITANLEVTDQDDVLEAFLLTSEQSGAGDYEKRKRRKLIEELNRQILADMAQEQVEANRPAEPKKKPAKVIKKINRADDEDELEALMLLM